MARLLPVDTLGDALATTLRAARASYTPTQKVVEYDEFWQYPATKGHLDARLPATIIQLDAGQLEREGYDDGGALIGNIRFRVNHIFPLSATGNLPSQGTGAIRKTLELLTADDSYALANWSSTAGIEIRHCVPVDFGLSDELLGFELGWAFVMVEIGFTSIPT